VHLWFQSSSWCLSALVVKDRRAYEKGNNDTA
jgi:hypothetical protein